jgi:hypothetical protein
VRKLGQSDLMRWSVPIGGALLVTKSNGTGRAHGAARPSAHGGFAPVNQPTQLEKCQKSGPRNSMTQMTKRIVSFSSMRFGLLRGPNMGAVSPDCPTGRGTGDRSSREGTFRRSCMMALGSHVEITLLLRPSQGRAGHGVAHTGKSPAICGREIRLAQVVRREAA